MAARYYTLVHRDLLEQIQNGTANMPDGFRLVQVVEAPTQYGCELCLFEDDQAPAELDGLNVSPTFQTQYDKGEVVGVRIMSRTVVERW